MRRPLIIIVTVLFLATATVTAAQPAPAPTPVKWSEILSQPSEWYGTDDSVRIADNVLLYQRKTGGWHKNIDMSSPLTEQKKAALIKAKSSNDSTIDNGATFTQLTFLAKVFAARKFERHRDGFDLGINYLLSAQYENGGWPQFYPNVSGYRRHITYNDNAMIGVMRLLRNVGRKKCEFAFVSDDQSRRATHAITKGIDVILKTQIVVGGKRTAWGAQHDKDTFAPAPARAFEPASLASSESVGIVRFLMGIDDPSRQVIDAIEGAIRWFEQTKLEGVKWVQKADRPGTSGNDRVLIKDSAAGPLWARFYELETNRPIFSGRDGIIKYDVSQIERERRAGYAWYVSDPAKLLAEEYPAWRKKVLRLKAAN